MTKTFAAFIAAVLIFSFPLFASNSPTIALVGGTVIDVSNFGNSKADIKESIILVEGEKIIAVGDKNSMRIPQKAKVIDIKGKYVLPGLIDGFACLDNQAFANAFLYMGVTSIVGVYGGRRALLFEDANPIPHIYRFGFVGQEKAPTEELLKQVDDCFKKGVKFLLLHYEMRSEQAKSVIEKAHELGMATIGELGYTSYREAAKSGIDGFIHSSRYAIELAPPET